MKKAIFWIVLMLLLISMLASTFITQPVKAESKIVSKTFSDDFSQDTGMWEYLGFAWPSYWGEDAKYVAYRDAEKGHVVLTPAEPHLAGAIWFKWEFTSPFTVNFKYLAGGGSGADGLVMMFYHEKPPYLWSGACLSFIGSGYGIEFDNHYNYLEDEYGGPPVTDPSENHIAIIKDNPSNHLIYVDDQRTEDNVWHSVTVDVDYSSITVYVDSQQVIQWQGTIDRTYGGFGFAGTTGSLTNQHLIDDFSITIKDWIIADIFDFPIGKPRLLGGSGFVTERNDGDGWYNAQDFGEYNPDMRGYHPGEDWNTEAGGDTDIGEPVYAVANGIVYAKRSSLGEGLGGGIVIKHFLADGSEVYSVYVHIDPNENLNVDQVVARGEQIGRIADIKYPAHLHFEIRTIPVDPNDWYPNDIGNGYYESVEKMQEDGFTVDPSYFICSHFGRIYGIPVEFRFTRDISKGMDNPEVRYLQILLNLDPDTQVAKSGIGSAGSETTYFGDLTESAVERFQEKYFKDILEPAGLPSGNGYVGYYTRKKLNEILEMFFTPLYKELHSLCDMEERKSIIWKYIKEFKSDYLPENFPNELILAVAAQETGEYAHWNNEHVADDWGRGIMQITTNSYVGAGGVDSTSEECIKARNREGKIYSSIYYSNTLKGIEANIKDGLYALRDKYQQVKEDKIQPPEGYTKDEIIWMSTVQRYNGFRANPSEYIWHIGDKLIRLANGEYGDFEGFNKEFARLLGEKFKKAYNEKITLYSPVQLRVYDTYGNVAGLVSGEVREDIPNSIYDNETRTVLIFFPSKYYLYNVIGIDEGTYGLNIESFKEGKSVSFTATEIPISTNATHQYTIDWDTLSLNAEGVTVQVDSDGDGFFEKTFVSDSKLTYKEFMFPTKATFTFNALWEGVNYPVIVSSSNSTIADFNFYQSLKQISFKVSGETGTSGYCNVTIPKNLLKGEPWTVRLNGTDWTFTATQNETHSFLYFTYTHSSTYEVTIQGTWAIPEFPSTTILLTFVLNTLTAIILLRKKRKAKSCIKL